MNNANFDFDEMMGKEVEDIVTGFKGIVTGKITWLFGCNQYNIMSKSKDGSPKGEEIWVDEGRLKVLGNGIRPQEVQADSGKRGAGSSTPSRMYPRR